MQDTEKEPSWYKPVRDFLAEHAPTVPVEAVAEAISQRTLVWEPDRHSEERLLLVRLTGHMLEREEVFMGSLLFADWLRKSFIHTVDENKLGSILPVTNDLEAGYFLLATRVGTKELAGALRAYVGAHLAELFLGDEDTDRGLHGSFAGMFSIPKSDFEPFPIFSVPRFLLRELEEQVRQVLRELIKRRFIRTRIAQKGREEVGVSLDYRLVQSTMAFFYGRTSGGIGDSQSHNTFMARLVTEYGVITAEELAKAYGLPADICPGPSSMTPDVARQAYKDAIDEAVKNHSFDESALQTLLTHVLDRFAEDIDAQPEGADLPSTGQPYLQSWFLPFIRGSGKPIAIERPAYVDALLHRVTLGAETLALAPAGDGWICRTCGEQQAIVAEKNILLGVSVGKFYNQLPNQPQASGRRICVRCALFSYLGTKLFGATTAGKFPVPKQDNLIFHFGRHTAEQVRQLDRRLGTVLKMLKDMEEERIRDALAKQIEQEQVVLDLQAQKEGLKERIRHLDALGEAISPEEQETLFQIVEQLGKQEFKGLADLMRQAPKWQVIDLGMGQERLMAFALPKMKDDLELADKRFVRARLTVYALIALLQDVCGCDGPFFFRTLPRLDEPEQRIPGYFYVERHVISAEEYRKRYAAAAAFAWGVTKGRGRDGLKDWLGMSERLVAEPLETFAQVLRDSPLHGGDNARDARYKRLSSEGDTPVFDRALNVWDGWEYLRAYRSLHDLWQKGDAI